MDQQTLRSLILTGDENAENECIAGYLDTLERICISIANRFNCDAEELVSEGYVYLVLTFRELVHECQRVVQDKGWQMYGEKAVMDLDKRLSSKLTLALNTYAQRQCAPTKAASIGEMDDTTTSANVDRNVKHAVSTIPAHLLNPFTVIAKLCHDITGTCYPPTTDEQSKYMQLATVVIKTYGISEADAAALLHSYEEYVDRILAAHFDDQQ